MTNNKVTINYKGQSVDCFGSLTEEDNIAIGWTTTGGEPLEDIVDNWNYRTDEAFTNWTEAVHFLIDNMDFRTIEQLETC